MILVGRGCKASVRKAVKRRRHETYAAQRDSQPDLRNVPSSRMRLTRPLRKSSSQRRKFSRAFVYLLVLDRDLCTTCCNTSNILQNREMDSGTVHDDFYDECPTDPDRAGIGVSRSLGWHLSELTSLGRRVMCISCTPDYRGVNCGRSPRREFNGRYGVLAEEGESLVQQEP